MATMTVMVLFWARVIAAVVMPLLSVVLVIRLSDMLHETDNAALKLRFRLLRLAAFVIGGFFTVTAPYGGMPSPLSFYLLVWGLLFIAVTAGIAVIHIEAAERVNRDEREF